MQPMQIWEIEGKSTMPHPVRKERVHEQLRLPNSLAYFCPVTGEIWARRIVMDEGGKVCRWSVLHTPARGQPDTFRLWPTGSILCTLMDENSWHTLPQAVLEREFLLYHDAYLKGEL